MGTLGQLIEQTRRHLTVGRRDAVNVLNGAISSTSATTFVYADTNPALKAGLRASIDLEDFLVRDEASKVATVVRGYNTSTAATHADGSLIYVDAEFSAFEIATALQDVLAALPSYGLAKIATVELSASSTTRGYNLTSVTGFLSGRKVTVEGDTSDQNWSEINPRYWRIDVDSETDDFASGFALFVYKPLPSGRSMRVHYEKAWTALTLTTAGLALDVETLTGLPARAHPILAMGAALFLTDGRPIPRSSMKAQGDTRRPNEVSTGDTLNAATRLERRFLLAIAAERKLQDKQYGL